MCAWMAFTILRYGIPIVCWNPKGLSVVQSKIIYWCLRVSVATWLLIFLRPNFYPITIHDHIAIYARDNITCVF